MTQSGPPSIDQGAQNFARGLGGGTGGSGGGPDDGRNTEEDANNKDMLEWAFSGGGKGVATLQRLLTGCFGINLNKAGKISLGQAFGGDTEGFAGKTIMPTGGLLPETQGGFLWQIFKAVFRNKEITDHTGGITALASNEGSGSSGGTASGSGDTGSWGGGSSDSHSFASFAVSSGMSDMFIAAGGGNNFEPRDVPNSLLGMLSPPTFGDAAASRGAGFSMA